jgi:hypothetical protein
MEINIFTLTTTPDHDIFAVGMSITHPDGEQEVVTYRRDPVTGQTTFATFDSPDRALARSSTSVPMLLEWQ